MKLQQRCELLMGVKERNTDVVDAWIDDADGGANTPGYTVPGLYRFSDDKCVLLKAGHWLDKEK